MRKPNIMFQGTGSSVGKSVLTAGVCRILNDRGYTVAPFKSQNMALNSFITKEGKEMGRAQVVQAEAARIEPRVEMNPILLKPSSDVGSQVVLRGEVFKNMDAATYHEFKPQLADIVLETYRKLEKDVDCIVLEGAGSPAEINLRENDIVNMGMAELCDAPVILIGDIDRGGVFASIYGTYMLLQEEEQKRIKGFVINKFRGDVTLLQSGIDMLEALIHVPCLGVVPYFRLHIDDEDSVTMRFAHSGEKNITVGVLRLPHISNFTDFTPFEMEEDVEVRYIKSAQEMDDVDLLILPGSKNTIEDMVFLKEMGMVEKIHALHDKKVPIFGICGGYQILGNRITDSNNHESAIETMEGLGLVDAETVISEKKRTVQVQGRINGSFQGSKIDGAVTGYEIHMGVTSFHQCYEPLVLLENGEIDGVSLEDGLVMGTYLHGIFDNIEPRKTILGTLRRNKGLSEGVNVESFAAFKERQYDELAELLENHLDMEAIVRIMKGTEV
ncbi:cobyric acid synthase [Alkalibacter rhizosphaerae]|uniref:Cobyric acid synthase n=1 Tax=Alkalibacter rhizosphaerae TaxID=2815577 RepID=A0A975AHE8_9FIRM|nr:cobyric acid synthase [Alkalibacter rhizosphaerae]QSX08377.1 cobyric acid synthase [Alkalibacter rhizosphaerae]